MSEPGSPAPAFTLPTLDGSPLDLLGELDRGPALLVFFKRNCGACQVAVPRLRNISDALPSVQVIGVSQDAESTTRRWTADAGVPVVLDAPAYEASAAYDVETVPHFVLVDPSGAIVETDFGWDRTRFNALAARAGELVGTDPGEVVAEGDGPPFRPG